MIEKTTRNMNYGKALFHRPCALLQFVVQKSNLTRVEQIIQHLYGPERSFLISLWACPNLLTLLFHSFTLSPDSIYFYQY